MKNLKKLLLLLLPAGIMMASCEGPMGPTGANGVDANQSCTECHNNSAVLEAKQAQWEGSLHARGENAAYANRTGCVQCHTSQGFLEYVAEGSTADISVPREPMQINCYTCHKIHETFTSEDYQLTRPEAVKLVQKYKGEELTWDHGNSNQCVSCHQALEVAQIPVVDGPNYTVTNTRMGPHHAPNSNVLLGKIPFELPGAAAYPISNPHLTDNGCVDCHMAQPYGYIAGGHNMSMTYYVHGAEMPTLLTTGCTDCHTAADATSKFNALITNVESKLITLRDQLIEANVYDVSTGRIAQNTFSANAVLAYLSYNTVVEDKSHGMHNPGYIKALLDNAIASMTALGYPAP